MSDNLSDFSGRRGLDGSLFDKLGDPERGDEPVGPAVGYASATFYELLDPREPAKAAHLCKGTCCELSGRQPELRQALEHRFGPEAVGEVTCLGRCYENGAFLCGGRTYSGLAPGGVGPALEQPEAPGRDGGYAVQSSLDRPVLTGAPLDAEAAYVAWLRLVRSAAEQVLDTIEASGLRGRGGAGFPMGRKLRACRDTPAEHRYVVCNADEGDPGAYTDRYLLEEQPMSVLLGMAIAGYACGARTGVLYVRAEYPEAQDILRGAIDELRAHGVGEPDFAFRFEMVSGAGSYVCGEESALLSSLEGQRPEPRIRPPFPAQKGLFNRPTVVQNVETLACLPWILEHGADAFRQLGTPRSSGTKLLSLDGQFRRPGVYEVAMGTAVSAVTDEMGGGPVRPLKAVHVGGPLGGLVPVSELASLTVDFESFEQAGFLLGHGSIVGIPQVVPMLDYLRHLFRFLEDESCGKCFPCRLGSVRGRELLDRAFAGHGPIDRALFEDLLDTLEHGSLCGLGGGLPLPARNALTHFADELSPHFDGDGSGSDGRTG